MNYTHFVQDIKSRISTKEVLRYYGVNINSRGFAKCPFHNEKTASMKVYDGDRGYHCFGCGKNGDIIDFVRDYFGTSFQDAVKKLNDDFSLGLPIGEKLSRNKQRELAKEAYKRRKQIESKNNELKKLDDEYWKNYDELLRLQNNLEKYKPTDIDEEWHPLYVEAVQNISLQQHLVECADSARYSYEKSNN